MRNATGIHVVFALAAALAAVWTTPATAQFTANRRPDRPEVTLPDGPVRNVILSSCTQCHGIDEYGYYAMGREHWQALIERMKVTKSGVVEAAVISAEDQEILLDWLVANFGPDTTAFPRAYVPRPMTDADYLSDAQAAALLASTCGSCHSLDVVNAAGMSEDEWRTRLVNEIARGSPLLLEDADPLIEWLAENRGAASEN